MQPVILIAEDDALQSALMGAALERRGYQADIVSNGLEAIRRLRTHHYDVALLDYHMPDVDGLATAKLLHDLMPGGERPWLIAVTAAAEGLSNRGEAGEDAPFDAIVSKSVGLPALMNVIDAHLTSAAEAAAAELRSAATCADRLLRSRMRRACVAGIPAFVVAASFFLALMIGLISLRQLDQAAKSAEQISVLSANTAALVGAVQDAEISERSFLATGLPTDKERLVADMQRVDRTLVAATPLGASGLPGDETGPQGLIEGKLKLLAKEAALSGGPQRPALSNEVGAAADEKLRDWASGVVSMAQQAVLTGLSSIQQNVQVVLAALGAGVCYALWNAIAAIRRRFQATPAISFGVRTAKGMMLAPPLAASSPTLNGQHP